MKKFTEYLNEKSKELIGSISGDKSGVQIFDKHHMIFINAETKEIEFTDISKAGIKYTFKDIDWKKFIDLVNKI